MNRSLALALIQSNDSYERLRAARFLARNAEVQDLPLLQHRERVEDVRWIRAALATAIKHAHGDPTPLEAEGNDQLDQTLEVRTEEIYAEALHEATRSLLHEIRPILGLLRLHAESEVPDFPNSSTQQQLSRLSDLLQAIDLLGRAAARPVTVEFELSRVIQDISVGELELIDGAALPVMFSGPKPLLVFGDKMLLQIAIRNGLRNALEAMAEVKTDDKVVPPIVMAWGETDRDYWVSILDGGPGLGAIESPAEIGVSTKKGHFGMGLAIASRAIRSLGGTLELSEAKPRGCSYEIRWPRISEK